MTHRKYRTKRWYVPFETTPSARILKTNLKICSIIQRGKIIKISSKCLWWWRNFLARHFSGRHTLSVKLSDFTVWRHTWRKNWIKCAVLTSNSAGLGTVLSSSISHTQNCAVNSRNPTVSSVYLPTPRWHNLKAHPFLAIHSADEHRMIYSFSNTTSYSTFYASFTSFRITLWPTWLANSKRQPCFYPSQSHAQEDT